jgi:RNA polymerase sigma-70 factor (ECF subfamily)
VTPIELVARASQGDHVAFERLAIQITPSFDAVARLILRDRALAEDAVQDAQIKIWRELPRLRDHARFDAWARRLLINACHDVLRSRRQPHTVDVSMVVALVPDSTLGVADREELAAGLKRLTLEQRVILVLRYYLQLEPIEIAETLGIPPGTARSRLHNALHALRAALDAEARGRTIRP